MSDPNKTNERIDQAVDLGSDVVDLAIDALIPSPDLLDVAGDLLGALLSGLAD